MGRVIRVNNKNLNIFGTQDLLDCLRGIIGDDAYFYLSNEYSKQEDTIKELNDEIFDLQNQLKDCED